MAEVPIGYLFTEPRRNYWLVEIDNQGNSRIPVGNPVIIRNYSKN